MKKRYLIIGNAENTHILKWVKALIDYYEVYIISSKTTHDSILELLTPDRVFNLDLHISGEGGNYKLLLKYFRICRIIKQVDPAVVNPHYITSHGFLAALIKKFNRTKFYLVQSAWGSDILVTPFRNKIYRRITRFCLRQADLATSDSKHMTGVLESIYTIKTLTFSFGLDELPAYDPDAKEDLLIYSNRMLSSNYKIGEVIRFFGRIAAKEPLAKMIIAHDGPERKSLEALVHELKLDKKVAFKGFVSEDEQIANYQRSRFYVSIPNSDATSVSLLEAMAYGCIPIVSDIPANREWISRGENGIYYQAGQTGYDDLTRALTDSESIAIKNREIILKHAIFPDVIRNFVNHINSHAS